MLVSVRDVLHPSRPLYEYTRMPQVSVALRVVILSPMTLTGQSGCMRSLLRPVSLGAGSLSLHLEAAYISVCCCETLILFQNALSLTGTPESYLAPSLGDGMNPITAAVLIHPEHALLATPRQLSAAVLTKTLFFFFSSKQRDRHPHSFLCVLQS